jgi:TetR/AcrR family transcriptional regulator, mexJK operon transcriptional repressor
MANRSTGKGDAEERILTAAADLFARFGYSGVSTRDVAAAAGVNEVTIYRHYSRKRDLFCAVLESQLKNLHLRGDLLTGIAAAEDGPEALERCFNLISTTLQPHSRLLRLMQFSVLELGDDFELLLRKHIGELVEVLARYLEPWVSKGELHEADPRALVLALVAIIVCHRSLHRVIAGGGTDLDATFKAYFNLYAVRASP